MPKRFNKGDRIEVTGYINDLLAPNIGDKGTVTHVDGVGTDFEQLLVNWDNGRSLMLVPEDYESVKRI